MRILVNFATRSRPSKFITCIENINSTCNVKPLIVVKCDFDDASMAGIEQKVNADNVMYYWGYSKSKIDAINRDIPPDWDVLVNFSDDMLFVRQGWDDEIRKAAELHGLDSCFHFPDQCPYREKLISMSILGKTYYDRFGYVYHPDYVSLWCDNETMDVAKILGKYVYMGGVDHSNIIYHHNHPAHVTGFQGDELLAKTESFYRQDEETYNRRLNQRFHL